MLLAKPFIAGSIINVNLRGAFRDWHVCHPSLLRLQWSSFAKLNFIILTLHFLNCFKPVCVRFVEEKERLCSPQRPECLQGVSMETCCENTAAARPGMRYLVCGEACYLTRGPPIATPCTPPRFVQSLIQMKIDTQLKGCWDDTDNSDLKSSKLCTQLNKGTCLSEDHMKASMSWTFCPPLMWTEWMFLSLL